MNKTMEETFTTLNHVVRTLERTVFDERQAYLREKSRADGIKDSLRRVIGLELDGIEDILFYMNNTIAASDIKERIDRIKELLK